MLFRFNDTTNGVMGKGQRVGGFFALDRGCVDRPAAAGTTDKVRLKILFADIV
jgi:hypothetical protein